MIQGNGINVIGSMMIATNQRKKLIEKTSTRSYDDSFMTCKKVVGEREASMMPTFLTLVEK